MNLPYIIVLLQFPPLLAGNRRHGRQGRLLIPISDTGQIERQAVVVAVLDCEPEGFVKIDRITDMKPIDMSAAQPADVLVYTGIPIIGMCKNGFGTPGGVEIILGAGAVQPRFGFSINEKQIIYREILNEKDNYHISGP